MKNTRVLVSIILIISICGIILSYNILTRKSEAETFTISGVVKDTKTGEPLPEVTVSIGEFVGLTDQEGKYVISNIPGGTYNLTASKTGYEGREVPLVLDGDRTADLALSPSAKKIIDILNFHNYRPPRECKECNDQDEVLEKLAERYPINIINIYKEDPGGLKMFQKYYVWCVPTTIVNYKVRFNGFASEEELAKAIESELESSSAGGG